MLLPLVFGWRTIFSHNPGKFRTIIYFACLGAGYIMVEVGLISEFMLALSNATVSASVLITGMLVFSGLGSFVSERYLDRARTVMPKVFIAIGALLIGYGLFLDRVLDLIGTLPYALRLVCCFALIFPPAFLMGFPMPIAMTSLARLGKDHMFLWAWGINGCFSVIGAALGSDRRNLVRLGGGADGRGCRLSAGDPRVLRRAAAAQTLSAVPQ